MEKIRLGKTDMMVSRLGLGGVPTQKVSEDEAAAIIGRCLDIGINFFDTAVEYTNSEGRIGKAIQGRRDGVVLATKSNYGTRQEVESNLNLSLKRLGVAEIDLYQFHGINRPDTYAKLLDPDSPLAVVEEAKKAGKIKHIGITTHSIDVAKVAVKSGLFETIMFPFNFVTREPADELLPLAREHGVGFIAMKPLAGGLIKNATLAFKYLLQFPDIVSIPGIQSVREIDEIFGVFQGPWQMTKEEESEMQRLRGEMDTRLCRRCNYCEPCPQGIPVLQLVDLVPFMINMPPQIVFAEEVSHRIKKAADCDKCGECEKKCPYGLPIMELIMEHSSLYQAQEREYQKQIASR